MNILDRLEKIRKNEDLSKGDFEKIIGKSSGYIGILQKKAGVPGSDVLIRIAEKFPNYSLTWLLTGAGDMLKMEAPYSSVHEDPEGYLTLEEVRDEVRTDLKVIKEALKENFETISEGIFHGLKDQQKILKFIDELDAEEIRKASRVLGEYLKNKGE